nr:unnamed protein product [Digitaria exilis]
MGGVDGGEDSHGEAGVFDADQESEDTLSVLVGVEVVRGGDGGGLRMVKHKTKRFVFPGNSINCIL